MTTSFFVPPQQIKGDRLVLPEDEARHASRVLRLGADDELIAVDGEGGWYRVRIEHVDRKVVVGCVVERRREVGEPAYELTLAVAILKQRARWETLVEKAAELGVRSIVPLVTERTERDSIRQERVESKLVAAMKQCGRSRIVHIDAPVSFEQYISTASVDLGLCCHESADPSEHILRVLLDAGAARRVGVLIGPEGGFTDGELDAARGRGWRVVSLAPRRLRAETAAVAAAAAVGFVNDIP